MSTIITAGNATNNGASLLSAADGELEFKTGSGAGTTALTLSTSQIATFSVGALGTIFSGTAVASTSGTSIDFTGIPAGVKRITVMCNGISKSSSANFLFQLGDSGGIETTGYVGNGIATTAGPTVVNVSSTAGFPMAGDAVGTALVYGSIVFTLLGSNAWIANGLMTTGNGIYNTSISGSKTLSDTLDRVRITTTSGTDTFDAGSINILYE
jgi:hypothetical protein